MPFRPFIKTGPQRHQLGLILDDDVPMQPHTSWHGIFVDGKKVGDMMNGVWSPRLGRNIGFALISRKLATVDAVKIQKDGIQVPATLTDLPFI